MMTTFGVTNSTLKIIGNATSIRILVPLKFGMLLAERRNFVDHVVVLGGMMLTLVCLYLIWMRIR